MGIVSLANKLFRTLATREDYGNGHGADHVIVDSISSFNPKGTKTQIDIDQPDTDAKIILAANDSRKEAVLYNNGTQIVFLGNDDTVSPTNFMFPLSPGAAWIDDSTIDAWWGVTESGTADIQGFEVA